MHSLSTSVVSLHSHSESANNAKKSKTTSQPKPSFIYFLILFYSFLSMGFGTGLIGPTLLKFGEQMKTPFEQTVYILFTRSFGFLAGTLIGGTLFDYFASLGRTLLAIAVSVMCISTLVIPLMHQLIPMIIVHLFWSLAAGTVNNLAQILTIRHYEQCNVNPYLQALHGAFAIGAFLSPLIIAPLLRKTSPPDQWHYAYWLIGFLHIPNAICISIYAIRNECCSRKTQEISLEKKEADKLDIEIEAIVASNDEPKVVERSSSGNLFFLGVVTVFLSLYVGGESAFGSYLHTYASLHLRFPKDIAAYVNSAFWASFAFGHLCGIPLSIRFTALQMIFVDLIGCISSLTLLYMFNKSSQMLWICSIFYGLSVASIYPSAIAFTEKYMFITGKRMSMLAVGGSTGDAIIPLLIGYSISPKLLGPIGFVLISLAVVILASLLFGFILLYVRHKPEKDECEGTKSDA